MIRPTVIHVAGDRDIGDRYIGVAKSRLAVLEQEMALRGLKQGVSRLRLSQRVTLRCWACFGLHGATITVAPIGGRRRRIKIPYCFANRTVALGVIVAVAGVEEMTPELLVEKSLPPDTECEPEPVCLTCMIPATYPESYYCSKGIRYSVEVCAGKDNYLLFEDIPSTDFSPFCPGETVMVVLHIANETPEPVLTNAKLMPAAESLVFPKELAILSGKTFSILPFMVGRKIHESYESDDHRP